jgi:EAL domain-containing protein (putative c-di-GMP-specific phosphodiesterase class I)
VSAQQLQRPGLVQAVADALAEHGVPPAMLDIELTESSLMEIVARVQGTLAELKALGEMLSLDDFGTGYSSLAYLKHFSLDKLKIDQSFVKGLPGNGDDAAIARTIVSIGHQLRLVVSAEGVETAEQAEFLRGIGCDELQGYHLGRPVPAEAAGRIFTA